jgi:hypothetical protein
MSSYYRKVHSLTYYNPMVRKVTNTFKDTNTKISFRTNNTIRNKLNIRTHFTKTHTPSGIYQLQCRNCDLSCTGQTCCRWNNDIKSVSDISRPMNPSKNIPPPPARPTFSTISMNVDPWTSLFLYYTQTTKFVRNLYIHLFHLASYLILLTVVSAPYYTI